MKVVALLGSPRRRGNSSFLAERFLARAEGAGHRPVVHELGSLIYKGCVACYACKTGREDCAVRDDLTRVLADVAAADLLVLATPVYFGDVTSQLKAFIDRTFSYFTPDYRTAAAPSRLKPGKQLVFIQTQGNPDESTFADIFPKYAGFLRRNSFGAAHLVRARGVSAPDDAQKRQEILDQLDRVANEVFGAPHLPAGDGQVSW
ncbi:flavodoxin family protein [Geomonas subterranea]|uniref:Flavodoxin family protein n=1 Tax=Geomonas subterranea TaxID=2847989 RepID=A0ABX8LI11_9BACT|nr:flavodoxin family protein [Geomonas subterranea]QXE91378.1 flavodoxin family protein [Geomonas subterranea]QXM10535.1 flavodoxin family protein [Geomonas subterranea]